MKDPARESELNEPRITCDFCAAQLSRTVGFITAERVHYWGYGTGMVDRTTHHFCNKNCEAGFDIIAPVIEQKDDKRS